MRHSNAPLFRAYDRSQAFLLTSTMPRTQDDLRDDRPRVVVTYTPERLTATVAERQEVIQ